MPLYSDNYYYGGSQPPSYYLPSYSPATSRISSPYSYSYMSPMSVLSAGIGANPLPRGLRSYSPMLSSISETSSPLLPRRDVEHRSSPRRLAGKTFYRQPRPSVIDTEQLDLSRRKRDAEDGESTPGMISRTKSIVRMHTKKLKENPDLKKKKTQAELLMEKYLIKEKPIQEKDSPTKRWSWEQKEHETPARRGTIKRRDSLSRVSQLQVPELENEINNVKSPEAEDPPSRKMSIDSELLKQEAAIFDCLIQEELGPNHKTENNLEDLHLESNPDSSESFVGKAKRSAVPYTRKKSSSKLLDESGMPVIEKRKTRTRKKKSSDKLILDEIKSSESPSDSDFKSESSSKPMKRRSTKRKKHGGALKFKIDSLHVEEKSSPKLLRKFKYEVIVEEGHVNDKRSDDISPKEAENNISDKAAEDIPCRDNQEVGEFKVHYDFNNTGVQEAKCDSNISEVNVTDNLSALETEKNKNKFPLKGKLLQRQFSVESDSEMMRSPVIDKDVKAKTETVPSSQEQSQIISAEQLAVNVKESSYVKSESNNMLGSESVHYKPPDLECDRVDLDKSQESGNKDLSSQTHVSIDCDSTKSNVSDSKNFAQSKICDSGLPPHTRPKTPDLSSPKGKLRDKALPLHSRSNTPDLSTGKHKSFDSQSSISESSNLSDSKVLIQGKARDKVLLPHSRSNTPDLQSPKNKTSDTGSSKSSISESGSLPGAKVLIQGKIGDKALPPHSRSNTPDLISQKNKPIDDPKQTLISKNSTMPDQKPFQGILRDKVLPPHSRSNTPDLGSPINKSFDSESTKSSTPERSQELQQNTIAAEKSQEKMLPPQSRSITPDVIKSKDNLSNSDSNKSSSPDSINEPNSKPLLHKKLQEKVMPPQYRSKTPDLGKKAVQHETSKSDPSTPVLHRKQFIQQSDNKTKVDLKEINKVSSPSAEKVPEKPNIQHQVNDPCLTSLEEANLTKVKLQDSANKIAKQEKNNSSTSLPTSQILKKPDLKNDSKGLLGKIETQKNINQQAISNFEQSQLSNKDCGKTEPLTTSENVPTGKGVKGNIENKNKPISKANKESFSDNDTKSLATESKNTTPNQTKNIISKLGPSINKTNQATGKNVTSIATSKKNDDEVKSSNKLEELKSNITIKKEHKDDILKTVDKDIILSKTENKPCNEQSQDKTISLNDTALPTNESNKTKEINKATSSVEKGSDKTHIRKSKETAPESNKQELGEGKREEKGRKVDKTKSNKKARPKSESDMIEDLNKNDESKPESPSVKGEKTSKKSNSLPKSKSENSSDKKKKSKDKKSDSKSPKKLKKTTSSDKTKEINSEDKSDGDKIKDGEQSSELSKRSTRLMHFINKCMKLSADNESLSIEISDEEAEESSSSSEYTSDSSEYTDDSSSEEESSDEQKGSTESRERGSPSRRQSNAALALDEVRGESHPHPHHHGRVTPPATTIPKFRKYTMDDFQFLKVLGKGSFGKVLLAELRGTQYYYAVKCLKKDVVLEDDDVECTLIERKVLALGTNHPYLCHLFCTFQTDSHLFFVMEYLNGGDLMFHIQQQGRFDEGRARFYAAEITSGLKFLHKKGIVYRDLKLDNILLDFDGHVRIADFGMCKLQIYLDRTADTFCGTPDYMAPEIIKGLKYNQCVDWWSFGILLYEMLVGQSPFSGCDEDDLFWCICNRQPHYPRFISLEAKRVLINLLEKESSKRLGSCENGAAEVMGHPFFDGLDWDRLERRELMPPFKPNVKHPLDVHYFDKHFTAEQARLTPIDPSILQSMDQAQFQGFSYTNPNVTD